MNLEELDQTLTQWRSELDAIQSNLLGLEDSTIFKIIKGERDQLQGATEQKASKAFEAVDRLWAQFALLDGVYKKAQGLRQNLPTWNKGKAIEDIGQILAADIVLDTEAVPFDQRGLFSGAERQHTVSPKQLKEMMARSFDTAKKVFTDLKSKIEALLQQSQAVRAEAESLKQQAESFGKGLPAELSELMARLESNEKLCRRDPLSVTTDLRLDMRPYLEKARTRVAELARERDKIRADATRAGKKLQELAELYKSALKRDDAAAATKPLSDSLELLNKAVAEGRWEAARTGVSDWNRQAEELRALIIGLRQANEKLEQVKVERAHCLELHKSCELEIENPQGLVAPGGTKSLTEWLDTLTKALPGQRLDALQSGLPDWNRECDQLHTSIESAIKANQRPLDKKKELTRRWAEAQRKTEEYKGRGLVVDKALHTFGDKAGQLMSQSKINLEEADRMIYSYEIRLGEMISKL